MVGGGGEGKISKLARVVLGNRSGQNETDNNQLENQDAASVNTKNTRNSKSSGSGSASDSGSKKLQPGLVRRDTRRFNRQNNSATSAAGRGSSSGHSSDQNNMDKQQSQQRALGVGSLTEKRPSITAEELTPIVLSQLQTTSKMKEESRKLRRGSRSSNSRTPASLGGTAQFDRQNSDSRSGQLTQQSALNSGSESECGEESRVRTAEAFMSGIQSAIQSEVDTGAGEAAGLSAELVGEVDSVLSKLMQSINKNDPSLMPLIVTLQASLKGTIASAKPVDSNKMEEEEILRKSNATKNQVIQTKDPVALSEFSTGNDDPFVPLDGDPNSSSKIPWKIRAARKRAMKHHTTGMTKDEFAKIKQSLMQSSADFQKAASSQQSYALTRNKSESAIKYHSTHGGALPNGNDEEDVGAQTEPVVTEPSTELGYASDVCDYNRGDLAKSQTPTTMLGGRGFLIQPVDNMNNQLSNSNKNDGSYIQQWKPNSLVSCGKCGNGLGHEFIGDGPG